MNIQELMANPPKFHTHQGQLISQWKLSDQELLFLEQKLTEGMKTIETGAGLSTIVFAIKGTEHTCIAPDEELINRIKAYCDEHSIAHSKITFLADKSEYALPRLQNHDFDLALIDGRHGFPAPFIDWFYMANLLKIGGILIIDDVNIWTCELLMYFLFSEKDWAILQETSRAAIFVKQGNTAQNKEYTDQPFVRSRSRQLSLWAKSEYLLTLLKRGKFLLFKDIVLERLQRERQAE